MTFTIEESNRNAAFIQNADGYDVAVLNRVESDDPNHTLTDEQWQELVNTIAGQRDVMAEQLREWAKALEQDGGLATRKGIVAGMRQVAFDLTGTPDPGSEPSDDPKRYAPEDLALIPDDAPTDRDELKTDPYGHCLYTVGDGEDGDFWCFDLAVGKNEIKLHAVINCDTGSWIQDAQPPSFERFGNAKLAAQELVDAALNWCAENGIEPDDDGSQFVSDVAEAAQLAWQKQDPENRQIFVIERITPMDLTLEEYEDKFRDELYRRCGILLADIDEREIRSAYKAGQSVADAITCLSGELALHDADEDAWCEEWTGVRPDKDKLRLCPYHQDSLTWDDCTDGFEGCEVEKARS